MKGNADDRGWVFFTCQCASAYGTCKYAGKVEYTDPFKRVLDISWVGEYSLGCVIDLGNGYGGDVRLEYALWGIVHRVIRAQRSGAEVPSEHLCFKLFCRPLSERGRDGLSCGLALQDVE